MPIHTPDFEDMGGVFNFGADLERFRDLELVVRSERDRRVCDTQCDNPDAVDTPAVRKTRARSRSVAHSASKMITILKGKTGKRKQTSYVVTQCDDRNSSRNFWQGRLTHSKWANVFIGLMHIYNPENRIYEGATNMIS